MARSTRSRAAVAATAVGLVLTVAGCNGDDTASGSDPSSPPSGSSSSPSAETSSAAPTQDTSPSVRPATGPLLDMPNATMNAPKGWQQSEDLADFATEANPANDVGAVRLSSLEYDGPTAPLDVIAKAALTTQRGFKRLPDVEVAGVTFYHLSGAPTAYSRMDTFGTRHDGYETSMDFELRKDVPAAEREKIVAEGLASFTWR